MQMRKSLFQNTRLRSENSMMLSFFSVLDAYSKKQLHRRHLPNLFTPGWSPSLRWVGCTGPQPPCALPAEVAAFLSVIVKCRSSRLMGPYRVPSGFSTAGSAMSSEGMTEFFHSSVNSSWAFLHTEAWENLKFKTLVLNQIEVGLGLE